MSRKQLIGRVLDDECKLMFHPAHVIRSRRVWCISILRKTEEEEEEHGEGRGNGELSQNKREQTCNPPTKTLIRERRSVIEWEIATHQRDNIRKAMTRSRRKRVFYLSLLKLGARILTNLFDIKVDNFSS